MVVLLGLTPAMPVKIKYDLVRSKTGDVKRALMDKDAFITVVELVDG